MIAMRGEIINIGAAVEEELVVDSWETLAAQTLSKPCRKNCNNKC